MADMYPNCKVLDVEVDAENPEPGIKQILRSVRPTWKPEHIKIHVCSWVWYDNGPKCIRNKANAAEPFLYPHCPWHIRTEGYPLPCNPPHPFRGCGTPPLHSPWTSPQPFRENVVSEEERIFQKLSKWFQLMCEDPTNPMNKMYKCSSANPDVTTQDAVIIKILKPDVWGVKDLDREFHNWIQLNRYNVAVPLLARLVSVPEKKGSQTGHPVHMHFTSQN